MTEQFSRDDVNDIVGAYLECAEWADSPKNEDGSEEETVGFHDSAWVEATIVVTNFIHASDLADLRLWADTFGLAQIGHDLWLTAARHGAGFWDRASDEPLHGAGRRLTEVAHTFPMDLYIGDDGWTYLS